MVKPRSSELLFCRPGLTYMDESDGETGRDKVNDEITYPGMSARQSLRKRKRLTRQARASGRL